MKDSNQNKNKQNIEVRDLIIVGTGPAGYTASIYASRYDIDNTIIGNLPGGTATKAHKICNYPGLEDISGMELGQRMQDHAKGLGAKEINAKVTHITREGNLFHIKTPKREFTAKSVILAAGTKRRKLNLPNEQKFLGKGVSYCATCDSFFYKDKIVGIVGGSSATTMAASHLAEIAKKVYIIYRGDALRGDLVWKKKALKADNVEVLYDRNLRALRGDKKLEYVILDKPYKGNKELKLDGIFVEIGSVPEISFVNMRISKTRSGYIKVKPDQSTTIKGFFAAGDITTASNNFKQVITAAAEGAIAAQSAYKYLSRL
jgi:thioredoxin reductase (NADPH)